MKNPLEKITQDFYERLTDELYDGVYFVNKEMKILFWNRRASKITGYTKREILGRCCYEGFLRHIDKRGRTLCPTRYCPLFNPIKTNKPFTGRAYLRRKDGVRVPVDIHTTPIRHRGKTIGAIGVFRDASLYERIERQQEKAKAVSLLDALTSLPNRRYITKDLALELNKFKRHKDDLHVAIADLDHFRKINDTYGRRAGDMVLRALAYILEQNLRSTDYIGRYGGEEFLIILPNTPRKNALIALDRIRRKVKKTQPIKGSKARVTISVGAAKAKSDDSAKSIIKTTNKALYKAKERGGNRIEFAQI